MAIDTQNFERRITTVCKECRDRIYPSDPSKPYYNHKYGWRIPSFCDTCNIPISERTTKVQSEINPIDICLLKKQINQIQAKINKIQTENQSSYHKKKYTGGVSL